MRILQDLTGAAPSPAFQVLPAAAGRKLLQSSGTGVQAQVAIQGSPDIQAAVAAALQQAVSSGQFQAALNQAGELPGSPLGLRWALEHCLCAPRPKRVRTSVRGPHSGAIRVPCTIPFHVQGIVEADVSILYRPQHLRSELGEQPHPGGATSCS